jgi:hypothetical protein
MDLFAAVLGTCLPPTTSGKVSNSKIAVYIAAQLGLTFVNRKFEHFSQVSSFNYFHQLLKLLQVDTLRRPLVQGLITSSSTGTEGLIQSSRFALIDFLETQQSSDEQKYEWVNKLIEDLVSILETNLVDDRYAIPALEISAFLVDTYISEPAIQSNKPWYCTPLYPLS